MRIHNANIITQNISYNISNLQREKMVIERVTVFCLKAVENAQHPRQKTTRLAGDSLSNFSVIVLGKVNPGSVFTKNIWGY
jgi:hypothetical protein